MNTQNNTNRGPGYTEQQIIDEFRKAMAEHKLRTPDDIVPCAGEVKRFHVEGDDKGTRNGWYVLFADGTPAGEFGSWRTGLQVTWCMQREDGAQPTPAERQAAQERIEQARAQREANERARQGEAARIANLEWNDAAHADDTHPYLQRKGVRAYNLRVGAWPVRNAAGEVFRQIYGTLMVPIMDHRGRIISLQGIFPERDSGFGRDKDFLKDGKKRGGFFMIGTPPASGGMVAICEGYATGATIHAATGWCVVVAFDAYNLRAVAEAMRETMPHAQFVICADNDQWTTMPIANPGVTKAREAGQAINARVIVPQFADTEGKPTDFNDLQQREGIDVVQQQLMAHTLPKPANDNTPAPVTPDSIDVYTPLPDVGGKGKPRATIENIEEICARLGVTVRYNVISKEEELLIPGKAFSIDNRANASFSWLESWCARFNMPTDKLGGAITYLADQNLYNPVANWIMSRPWDGVKRLQKLCDTITPVEHRKLPDGRNLRDTLITRWMISAVAAAFQPDGVSAHGVLVLQGDQYLGKTKWFKTLVPAELGLLKDGMILRPDDKDSVKQVCSFWLVELGELDATFKKSDIAALKSFITNQSDVLRRAYARKESHFARRTVFFGSVNPREFLHDTTGNRRYWTIDCAHIDHSHDLDMQQVWAEVYELFKRGEGYYLTPDEMTALNAHNEAFQVIDPIEERIQVRLAWDCPQSEWEWKTTTEILLQIGMDRPTQSDATKAGAYIRKMNGGQHKRMNSARLLLVPPKSGHDYDKPF